MSQQVKVERTIQFVGDANQEANVEGNFLTKRACRVDWFDQKALDETNGYTITVGGASDAVAVSGGGVIGVTMLTGTGDNEVEYFAATPLVFDVTQNPALETKINVADVSGSFFFFGFSDAVTETTPNSTIDYADGTLAATATDAVGFICDGDKASSKLYCAYVGTGITVGVIDTGIVWTDGVSHVLRVEIDSSCGARWYVDGTQVGYKATACTDVPLCAMFNAGNREAAANSIYARYLAKFQDIP